MIEPSGINPRMNDGGEGAFSDEYASLTDAGRGRRDAMLPMLRAAVVREGRRRRARRAALRGASALAIFIAVGVAVLPGRVGRLKTEDRNLQPSTFNLQPSTFNLPIRQRVHVRILQDDPEAIERMIARSAIDPARYTIDDRQLVATLAAIGRPAGLIRKGGTVRLTATVVDALPIPKHPDSDRSPAANPASMQRLPAG